MKISKFLTVPLVLLNKANEGVCLTAGDKFLTTMKFSLSFGFLVNEEIDRDQKVLTNRPKWFGLSESLAKKKTTTTTTTYLALLFLNNRKISS